MANTTDTKLPRKVQSPLVRAMWLVLTWLGIVAGAWLTIWLGVMFVGLGFCWPWEIGVGLRSILFVFALINLYLSYDEWDGQA